MENKIKVKKKCKLKCVSVHHLKGKRKSGIYFGHRDVVWVVSKRIAYIAALRECVLILFVSYLKC
jgi:hypothetical protein